MPAKPATAGGDYRGDHGEEEQGRDDAGLLFAELEEGAGREMESFASAQRLMTDMAEADARVLGIPDEHRTRQEGEQQEPA